MRTMPLVVGLVVGAVAFGCDRSPTAPPTLSNRAARASLIAQLRGGTTSTGLIACAQTYDSVTQVIGPLGGLIAVGHHFLWVDSLALGGAVSITAVAPAGTVRWVRHHGRGPSGHREMGALPARRSRLPDQQ